LQTSFLFTNSSKLDSLLSVLHDTTSDTVSINVLNRLCSEYRIQGDYSKALQYGDQALQLGKQTGHKRGMATSYNNIGNIYSSQGNYPKALEYNLKSLAIERLHNNKGGIAGSYNNLGNIYLHQGDYSVAMDYYFRSLKIREELGNKQSMARVYDNIGFGYHNMGNYPLALEYHLKSLSIDKIYGDKRGMAVSNNNIGNIYDNQSDYPTALKYHLKCLKIAESLDYKRQLGISYNNLGNIHFVQNNTSKALAYYVKSLKIEELLENKEGIAASITNIGAVYTKLEEYPMAIEYLLKGLGAYSSIGHKPGVANSCNAIGGWHTSAYDAIVDGRLAGMQLSPPGQRQIGPDRGYNLLDSAANYHYRALAIQEAAGHKKGMIISLKGVGNVFEKKGAWEDAIHFYEKARILANQIGTHKERYEIYGLLAALWKRIADCKAGAIDGLNCNMKRNVGFDAASCYQTAYDYYNNYAVLKDSVFNENKDKRLALLHVTYETEKKERQIVHLGTQNELKDQKVKAQRYWMYLVILGIIAISLLAALLVRNLRRSLKNNRLRRQLLENEKQQLNSELKLKNKELENLARRIVEKNETLEDLKKQVINIEKENPVQGNFEIRGVGNDEGGEGMKELLNSINHSLYLDNDRKELELLINQHHHAFLSKLTKRSPGLTKTEKRLCSLLAMELSSKDIAVIMSITPESVKTSRNRLRKKLGLAAYTNLPEFLKDI